MDRIKESFDSLPIAACFFDKNGVVRLIKAILDQPTRWENFLPAIAAFALSVLLGWIF